MWDVEGVPIHAIGGPEPTFSVGTKEVPLGQCTRDGTDIAVENPKVVIRGKPGYDDIPPGFWRQPAWTHAQLSANLLDAFH
jgi:hypothetical protein